MKYVIGIIAFYMFSLSAAVAQESNEKVVIRTEKGTKTIEQWGEELGELISASILKAFDIEEGDTNLKLELNETSWEELGQQIEETTRQLTSGLEVEMHDIDPQELDGDQLNGFSLRQWVTDIGEAEGSAVEKLNTLIVRLNGEEGIDLKLDAILENGRTLHREKRIRE